MPMIKTIDDNSKDEALQLLQQILQLYKVMGPQSMENLTKAYLSSTPTKESAKDATEELMAKAYKIFDNAVDSKLTVFAEQQGFNLLESSNYREKRDDGYFQIMYPVVIMFMIWLDQEGEEKILENLGKIFYSMMFGVAGYVILDSNLDETKENPAEILLSLSFIQEYERLLLEAFQFSPADYELLNHLKQLYLVAEIKEKRFRFVRSPYTIEHPEDCGYKAVHGYLPFVLLLQKIGKKDQIDDYLQFFYEWGAPLQIMDDIIDLEEDLKNGHYSYPTIGFEGLLSKQSPTEVAATIKSDVEHLKRLYHVCKELIESSRNRCVKLKADLLGYFVNILEARIDSFFSNIIKSHVTNEQSG